MKAKTGNLAEYLELVKKLVKMQSDTFTCKCCKGIYQLRKVRDGGICSECAIARDWTKNRKE